jgi:hypothetical protein
MIIADKIIDGKRFAVIAVEKGAGQFDRQQPYRYSLSYLHPTERTTRFVDTPGPFDIVLTPGNTSVIPGLILTHMLYFGLREPSKDYVLIFIRDDDRPPASAPLLNKCHNYFLIVAFLFIFTT